MNRTHPLGTHPRDLAYEHEEIWRHLITQMPGRESLIDLWPASPEDLLSYIVE